MGRVVRLAKIPDCDFCAKEDEVTPAVVDGKTVWGFWANMCEEHRKRWSKGAWTAPGEHELENPLALEEPIPLPPAPGTAEAIEAQVVRDDFIREAMKNPPMDRIEAMVMDDEMWEALDGCIVEMDGRCPHDYPSWAMALGMV